jgi:hypothetical protein
VNRAVSFNAIKSEALGLLAGDLETGPLPEKSAALSLTSPCLDRKGPKPAMRQNVREGVAGFSQAAEKALFLNMLHLNLMAVPLGLATRRHDAGTAELQVQAFECPGLH